MADLSDITAYLAAQAALAVYPNGSSQPSVANMDVRIFEGWPNADAIDRDLAGQMLSGNPPVPVPRPNGPCANVSIYPMLGTGVDTFQQLDDTYTIVPPVFGLSVNVTGSPVTVDGLGTIINISGAPTAGEYVTIEADRQFIFSATGASVAAIIAALATQASVHYFGVSTTSSSITIPVNAYLSVRQGAVGTLGKVTHRQRHQVMITTWAPTHESRTTIASAIDVALKQVIVAAMPDTSQAKFCYSRTNVSDEQTNATLYRRDLIYECEYATLFQFPGYVITSMTVNIQGGNWGVTTQPPTIPTLN